VLLGARNRALGEAAADRLQPGDVRCLALDLEDSATIAQAAAFIGAEYGRLDILVNNAGIVAQGDGFPSVSRADAIERAGLAHPAQRSGLDPLHGEVSGVLRLEIGLEYVHRAAGLGTAGDCH
jgi:NAD(P)-dependent dehydrogenase (short-subunit alcohol dehydrogenase family)